MHLHPGTEPVPIRRVRTRKRTRLRSAKTTGTGPFPRCGTAIPWLRFNGTRSPMEMRLNWGRRKFFNGDENATILVNTCGTAKLAAHKRWILKCWIWIDVHRVRRF